MKGFMIFIVFSLLICLSVGQNENNWFGQRVFDPNYVFKWRTDSTYKSVIIRVECRTKGWIGIGFSRHGKATETDMAIGWVNDQGQSTFNDFWINEFGVRSVDRSQDWTLLSGEENATHTVLEFRRNLLTCDETNDVEIYENDFEMSNIVFAYSFIDPNSIETIGEATVQGVIHLNLFERYEPLDTNLQIMDNWFNMTLPPKTNEYFCQMNKLNLKEKLFIIKYQPLVSPKHVTHHFDWIKCPNMSEYLYNLFGGVPHKCLDMKMKIFSIDRTKMCLFKAEKLLSNEQTVNPIVFPKGVGMSLDPIEGPYYVFLAHLINPSDLEWKTSLSYRLWLTKSYKISAGSLLITNLKLTIPPRQPIFRLSVLMSSFCFDSEEFNENGIFIFQTSLHTHHGQKTELRHYRKDRLKRVLEFNNYVIKEQPFRPITPPINFRLGDKLATICKINTINSTNSTTTAEDQCSFLILYYPFIPIFERRFFHNSMLSPWSLKKITGLEVNDSFPTIKLLDFIQGEKYKIKDPKELEEFQLRSDTYECCTDWSNFKSKRCKLINVHGNFYESIINEKHQNFCLNEKLLNKRVETKPKSMNIWTDIIYKMKLSFDFLIDSLKQ